MKHSVNRLSLVLSAAAALLFLAACPNPWLPWSPQASPTPTPSAAATPTPLPSAGDFTLPSPVPNPTPKAGGDIIFIEDGENALDPATWTVFSDEAEALAVIDSSDAWSGAWTRREAFPSAPATMPSARILGK